jgi:hypothetical protein
MSFLATNEVNWKRYGTKDYNSTHKTDIGAFYQRTVLLCFVETWNNNELSSYIRTKLLLKNLLLK